jgi:acetolactate synthase-1/2/3 large subunit
MPVVGLGGAVPRAERLKQSHQSLDTVSLFKPVTKYSVEVEAPEAIGEGVANAFRAAESGRPGAAFISLPMDIMTGSAPNAVLTPVQPQALGSGPIEAISEAARLISEAELPVLLLGMQASEPANAQAVRALIDRMPLGCVSTYQGAGTVPRSKVHLFAGRVGLFHNQPADQLLDQADVVITVGYDPIEYDESLWNHDKHRTIIHIDNVPSDVDVDYKPTIEITGNIAASLALLSERMTPQERFTKSPLLETVRRELDEIRATGAAESGTPIHPLRILSELEPFLTDDTTMALDMGSFHIWHARYLYSFRPRQMLISNGQQTLGVALPWAIAACLARPRDKVISVSGDGGFLYSAAELETAVRLKCHFIHLIWRDGTYDMVAFQERLKYGRTSGCDFGPVDAVKYAEAFGAKGFAIKSPDELAPTLKKAMDLAGPVLIDISVDYSHNAELGQQIRSNRII